MRRIIIIVGLVVIVVIFMKFAPHLSFGSNSFGSSIVSGVVKH